MTGRVLAASLALLLASEAHAQGTVRGILRDSLRSFGPLEGAEVVLSPGNRRATTDQRGRFVFSGVPEGTYRVSYPALWLDSVGVAPPTVAVDVRSGRTTDIALVTGSRVALARTRCGGEMDADRGLVVGEVRDARGQSLAGAIVVARWSETVVGGGPVQAEEYISADTVGSDGRFALCGMLAGAEVVVHGRHPDGRRSGAILLAVDPAVYAYDLMLSDPAQSVRLVGRIVNGSGAPVPRAEVIASAATSGTVRTDSAGRFELEIERGSRQLAVRVLGFLPALHEVRATESRTDIGDIVLQPVPTVLDTVVVRANALTREELEYEYRRSTQSGVFIGEADLRKFPQVTPNAIASLSPGWVRATQPSPGNWGDLFFRGPFGFCRPRLFVNGRDWGNTTTSDEVRGLVQMAVRLEMYRATLAPPQFTDFDGCGALVVWLY
ncbi:MAG: carboxypeptidase regulatory-like domain-containing protein [Gemmatimonadaceae bacterium]|nr:carboxypeptidase regulatory-like domain-containing protein [Gemmatimonadaceae bacterium]MCW5826019.1 carboxypeptidase regulatory-like domain-containing protein [Gemmatimonadaceae bacterium]